MKIWIPAIGDTIALDKDWEFNLEDERRNKALIELFWDKYDLEVARAEHRQRISDWRNDLHSNHITFPKPSNKQIVLPAGCHLKIDRIYIKKGAPDYNSVTFYLTKAPDHWHLKKKPRFWAKLYDVNLIEGCKV